MSYSPYAECLRERYGCEEEVEKGSISRYIRYEELEEVGVNLEEKMIMKTSFCP
jgi:hypothetical protein